MLVMICFSNTACWTCILEFECLSISFFSIICGACYSPSQSQNPKNHHVQYHLESVRFFRPFFHNLWQYVKTPLERLSTRTATHFQHLPKGATPQVFDDLIVRHGTFTTALIRAATCRHELRTGFRLSSKGVTCHYGFTRNSSRRRLHFQIAQFFEAGIADTNLRSGVNFGDLGTKHSTIQ